MATAKRSGDPRPSEIEAVKTTYLLAEEAIGPERSGGQANGATAFLVAMRGHFTGYDAMVPAGAQLPTGTVMAAIFSRALRETDGHLGRAYPRMAHAGRPIRLR